MPKNGLFWREKSETCVQTVLLDRLILIGQKWLNMQYIKSDYLSDFQPVCS